MKRPLIEYLRPDGEPLRIVDLGLDFIQREGLPLANAERPLRVEAEAKTSKKGNTYYECIHKAIPLPDGLNTQIRFAGVVVPLGPEYTSNNGNPTRAGNVTVHIAGLTYEVSVLIVEGKQPYWIKVHAHKASGTQQPPLGSGSLSGGRIV